MKKLQEAFTRPDTTTDLVWILAFFGSYFAVDTATRWASTIDTTRIDGFSLAFGASRSSPIPMLGLLVVVVLLCRRSPERFMAKWSALEEGHALRWIAIPLLVLLAWQGALYDINFVADRLHVIDRLLIVLLALAAAHRPAFLVPFVVHSRIIANQFDLPFSNDAGQNIDELLVIALVVLAVAHLLYVATGRADTAPVVLVLGTAIATHFFVPGREKVALDWVTDNDISNLAINSYTAGWRQQGDGGWAEGLSDFLSAVRIPAQTATLALELGSVIAVAHHRLLRLWLPAAIIFHIVNFAITGYWFLGWIVLEITLLMILWRRPLASWVGRNATPGRAVIAMAMVAIAGSTLFHPPKLAWYDSTLAYGYQIEAVGSSGRSYHVPFSAFSPFEEELAFSWLQFGPNTPLVYGYGALGSYARLQELEALQSVKDVRAYEGAPIRADVAATSVAFIEAFLVHANDRAAGPGVADLLDTLSPVSKFWTGRPAPNFDFSEPLRRLDVVRITTLQTASGRQATAETVLTLVVGPDGVLSVAPPDS